MIIKPVGKRVLIEKIWEKAEEVTGSGIILHSQERSQEILRGKVVALGEVEGIELGDEIIYGIQGEIQLPGEKVFFIVNLENIYALKRG